ncbi:MAG TPA: hypothetical protein VF538_04770 [Pyrinomonadaceae bacterium]
MTTSTAAASAASGPTSYWPCRTCRSAAAKKTKMSAHPPTASVAGMRKSSAAAASPQPRERRSADGSPARVGGLPRAARREGE